MSDSQNPNGKSLGMGGEAMEYEQVKEQDATANSPSPAAARQQNTVPAGPEHDDEPGLEPLIDRDAQHVPGYGGMLGAARTSADTREAEDPAGDPDAGGHMAPP